jgi:phage terminase large subunit-like protein
MDKQLSTKNTHKTKARETRTPLKNRDELRYSRRVSSSCTRRANLVAFIYEYTSVKHTPHIVSLNSSMTGISSGTGHVYPSEAPAFTPDLLWVRVAQSVFFLWYFVCHYMF